MKAKTSRTEIKIETHEIKVVRFSRGQTVRFCAMCEREVTVLALDIAGNETDQGLVLRLAHLGNFHLLDASENSILICGSSLYEPR